MRDAPGVLPRSDELGVNALSRLFIDTATSYKHLFFSALLKELKDSGFAARAFSIPSLTIGMLAAAWYPLRMYRLSPGRLRPGRHKVAGIELDTEEAKFETDNPGPARDLKAFLSVRKVDCEGLSRFVPYRRRDPRALRRATAGHWLDAYLNYRLAISSLASLYVISLPSILASKASVTRSILSLSRSTHLITSFHRPSLSSARCWSGERPAGTRYFARLVTTIARSAICVAYA